jgi:hypothetical protein
VTDLPDPLTPPDCDCTDLDGFMLNVERLMASELVALSTHEIIAAAMFVWCRAWKQRPAASLPDDDRVIAAFARLPLAKFRRFREEVLRGFVKCSDGRLYHRTLAAEAGRAFERKTAFHRKRETDNQRLKKWRANKGETPNETHDETTTETQIETRFVAEGQLRDRDVTVRDKSSLRSDSAPKAPKVEIPEWIPSEPWSAFVEMRRKIKAPLTDRAMLLTIAELRKLRATNDIGAVLDQSVAKAWRGVFPVKHQQSHGSDSPPAVSALLPGETTEHFRVRIFHERNGKAWSAQWGPPPTDPDCGMPRSVLEEFGYRKRGEAA